MQETTITNNKDIQNKQTIQKLQNIYAHKQYLDEIQQKFVMGSFKEHERLQHNQIMKWLHIHFEVMEQSIKQKKPTVAWMQFRKTNSEEQSDELISKSRKRTLNVPCETYQVSK